MNVSSSKGWTTASGVFLLDDYLPTYYEVAATFNLDKPTGQWKANGYIIFDYHSDVDFKASCWHDSVGDEAQRTPTDAVRSTIAAPLDGIAIAFEEVKPTSYMRGGVGACAGHAAAAIEIVQTLIQCCSPPAD